MELMEVAIVDDVPQGYKRFELGDFPSDWKEYTLLEMADGRKENFDDGDWIEAEFLTHEGVRLIQTGNLGEGQFIDKEDKKYISEVSFQTLSCKSIEPGDLLVCRLAAPAGRSCILPNLDEERMITSVDVTIFRPRHTLADKTYLNHVFTTKSWLNAVALRCGGTTHSRIARSELGRLAIPLPPLAEQRAIATALSDADALLGGLEALIAKKQAIKQGAMQALLTPPGQPGHKRLPEFEGEWGVKTMNELGSVYGGLTGKSKVDFGNGMARYIPFMNIMNGPVIDTSFLELVNVMPGEVQNRALKGDLFFNGSSETPEEVGMCSMLTEEVEDLYLNSFSFGFHLNKEQKTDGLFLAYWFRSSAGREVIFSSAQGATRYNLAKTNFLKLEVPCPKPLEQTAIATVLTDMDAELLGLEQQLGKLRLVKQGMMQELLTGRKRLV